MNMVTGDPKSATLIFILKGNYLSSLLWPLPCQQKYAITTYAWGQTGQGNKAIKAEVDLSITLNTTT